MEFNVQIGSGAIIYIERFINIGSGILNLLTGIHGHTAWRSHKPTFAFSK
jgi:hypothetical protein